MGAGFSLLMRLSVENFEVSCGTLFSPGWWMSARMFFFLGCRRKQLELLFEPSFAMGESGVKISAAPHFRNLVSSAEGRGPIIIRKLAVDR